MTRLQKKLVKEVGMLKRTKNPQPIEEKEFAVVINFESMGEKEKIFDMLEYLDCESIYMVE